MEERVMVVGAQIGSFLFFFKILFIHERHTERGRDIGRGKSRLHAGSPCGTRSWELGIMS